MTKEEFKVKLKSILDPLNSRSNSGLNGDTRSSIKKLLVDVRHMAWTHCHSCGRSNERLNCRYAEEFRDLNHACHSEGWTCMFCENQLDIYCGWNNGERCELPFYEDILKQVQDIITEGLLLYNIG